MKKTSIMCFLVLVVILLGGCQDDIDKHYERPTYLLGSTYEFLEKRGNFTLFLEAVDKTPFKTGLDGSGLFTVFAPADDAVKAYLSKIGKTSLLNLDPIELEVLIGYHIVEFSYKPDDFLGFTKTASSEKPEEADGYAHRFKTLAREGIRKRLVGDDNVEVFSQEKFLPVISTTLLKEKRSPDYEGDYRFFFPDVTWKGDNKQFYVAGASVLESGIPADNGYVYVVDKVLEPLPTIYDAFLDEKIVHKYSLFKELYDRFALIEYNQKITQDYGQLGDSLFLHRHYLTPKSLLPDLPDIADEWTVDPSNSDFEARMRTSFNAYIPTNDSIRAFCSRYFADSELKDPKKLPLLTLFYLLSSHVPYGQEIVLPSDIDKGIEGLFGEKWSLKKADLVDPKFCSNGVFYGIKPILKPAVFTMITEPLFKYKRFSMMASLFHKTQNLLPLVDKDRDYSLLLLSNTTAKDEYGYVLDFNGYPTDPDILGSRIKVFHDYVVETVFGDEKVSVEMTLAEQTSFVKSQIIDGFLAGSSVGRKFFATSEPLTYLYKENDDIFDEAGVRIQLVEGGRLDYKYDGGSGRGLVYEVKNKVSKNTHSIGRALAVKTGGRHQKFYQKLLERKLITIDEGTLNDDGSINPEKTIFKMDWLNGERCMVFAPSDEAFDLSRLPADTVELTNYLKYHFVSLDQNQADGYVLPGLGQEKKYETKFALSISQYALLEIKHNNTKCLNIVYGVKNVLPAPAIIYTTVPTDGDIPYFASDGIIYGIDEMISREILTIE